MDTCFVDFHSHLVPGIDDGAVDSIDSLEMARTLASYGFGTVHCTPHLITGGFENRPDGVRSGVAALQEEISDAGIPVRLVAGTEHYFDEYLLDLVPAALTVGGSRYLLVEIPFRAPGDLVPAMVVQLRRQGVLPLFAHPERCAAFAPPRQDAGLFGALGSVFGMRKETSLEGSLVLDLKQSGCKFQGNIGSFAGVYGAVVRQRSIILLKNGIYSCLGSDAHTSQGLAAILESGLDTVRATVGETAARQLLTGELVYD
ncbi:tyrosine-protein phosphatase YwqE [Geomonas limicola]|uniref:protein-tyrosine-phosphatase n=1 Tax=Geomonas limicola TaxID=2740186 RepID=A0A6V8N9J8_9BACT|nr:CpsB/CapC family capsule biosynthesis tyrosine phosphatase [Geomonas limicola]GFO69211.1 tyrosine-protein phosphatase YwqE [Geomonas limicola]